MPRLPVDGKKVVEQRITLGAKERELLTDFQWTYSFKNVSNTITTLISNPAVMAAIAAYIIYKLDQILDPDWQQITSEMTPDEVKDWLETQNLVGMGLGGTIGAILGLGVGMPWLGAILGSIAGGITVEAGEAVAEAADEMWEGIDETVGGPTTAQATIGAVSFLIRLERAISSLIPDMTGGGGGGGGGGVF